ncbi:hypothetical protein KSP39_PZI010478 [Platanthera zijinensis]|uniref:Uncharacterized protein n=1 Tax=Platanthera zijinensis TaxID=2320716 RepID=A0AAP0BJ09_9ASPA
MIYDATHLLSCQPITPALSIMVADDTIHPITIRGLLHTTHFHILDIVYIPELSMNLISVRQLISHGYLVTFDVFTCRVHDRLAGALLGAGRRLCGVYVHDRLHLPSTSWSPAASSLCLPSVDFSQWHHPIGHPSVPKNLRGIGNPLHFSILSGPIESIHMHKRHYSLLSQPNNSFTLQLSTIPPPTDAPGVQLFFIGGLGAWRHRGPGAIGRHRRKNNRELLYFRVPLEQRFPVASRPSFAGERYPRWCSPSPASQPALGKQEVDSHNVTERIGRLFVELTKTGEVQTRVEFAESGLRAGLELIRSAWCMPWSSSGGTIGGNHVVRWLEWTVARVCRVVRSSLVR